MSCSGSPLTRAFNFHTYPLSQPCPVSFIFRSTSHGVFGGCLHNSNHRRAVVIYCLRHVQVARKYFNNGERRGKFTSFFKVLCEIRVFWREIKETPTYLSSKSKKIRDRVDSRVQLVWRFRVMSSCYRYRGVKIHFRMCKREV